MTVRSTEEVFAAERPRLVGLAYRITGSRFDAEDIVQNAWLRAQQADWSAIDRPEAWLTTVVSRLALDELRSATHRRETYVGPWLPEPVRFDGPWAGGTPGTSAPTDPADAAELSESLTFGFLRLLEALSPIERVVFLLAEVFPTPYREIAAVVDRPPETCRQIATRARRHVQAGRVRPDPVEDANRVAQELIAAVGAGDLDRVMTLLADDVVLVSDGGAQTYAARRPVRGRDKVARFVVNLGRRYAGKVMVEGVTINGEPGVLASSRDKPVLVLTAQVTNGTVQSIHAIRNPDKLAALALDTPIA
jgi:RNA polymerase sigma-70 factor (ECF subfamily)